MVIIMSKGKWKNSENTKIQIAEAFKILSKEKRLDKIAINDITNYCHINRNTFYYHFEDIYCLMSWLFDRETKNLLEEIDLKNSKDSVTKIVNYIEKNKYLLNCILISYGQELLKKLFYDTFYSAFNELISNYEKERKNKPPRIDNSFKEFLINFYCGGFAYSIITYFQNNDKTNKKELIDNLVLMLESVFSILNNL